jgi:CBS domain-containing protein
MTQVRDVMTSNPTTCSMEASVADAATVMAQEDVGPIPIMDGDRLVGIVTDRDVVVRVVAKRTNGDSERRTNAFAISLKGVCPTNSRWPSFANARR